MSDYVMNEHPAAVFRRSAALVSQIRAGDGQAVMAILAECYATEESTAGTVITLSQLVSLALDRDGEQDPDEFLQSVILRLAAGEGQDKPAA